MRRVSEQGTRGEAVLASQPSRVVAPRQTAMLFTESWCLTWGSNMGRYITSQNTSWYGLKQKMSNNNSIPSWLLNKKLYTVYIQFHDFLS